MQISHTQFYFIILITLMFYLSVFNIIPNSNENVFISPFARWIFLLPSFLSSHVALLPTFVNYRWALNGFNNSPVTKTGTASQLYLVKSAPRHQVCIDELPWQAGGATSCEKHSLFSKQPGKQTSYCFLFCLFFKSKTRRAKCYICIVFAHWAKCSL